MSPQQTVFIIEHPVIVKTKAVVMKPAMKPCIRLHDVSASVCTAIADWQDGGEDCINTCALHWHRQGCEALLHLAQVLFYCVIGAHIENSTGMH